MPIRSREDPSTSTSTHRKTISSASSLSTSPYPDMSTVESNGPFSPTMPASKYHEHLNISSVPFQACHDHSPTFSTTSSSQHEPSDTATTYSLPMSPTSSTFTRATTPDPENMGITMIMGISRPQTTKTSHQYRKSCDSGSTFVNSVHGEDRYPACGLREVKTEDHPEVPSVAGVIDVSTGIGLWTHDEPPGAGTPRPQTPVDEATSCATLDASRPEQHPILGERLGFDKCSGPSPHPSEAPMDTSTECSDEEVDDVLNYVLQAVYGVELDEVTAPPDLIRHFAARFIQDVGRAAFRWSPIAHPTHATSTSTRGSSTAPAPAGSTTRRNSQQQQQQQQQQQGGKRKKAGPGRPGDEEGDNMGDEEGDSGAPFKRAKQTPKEPDEGLRLSCPFRKKNPARFNVREHYSCSMTYFSKFAELRQHIVKQHKRVDPSAFVCDRCNRDFPCRKDLRDHQRLPREQMCDITDHDPESGIDGSTATKLLSRKRASGMSADVQWREIWGLLFPDDEDHQVESWEFCPVIEHFEVTTRFMDSLEMLESSLRDKGLKPQALETIGNLYRNQFIQVLQQCVDEAKVRPYSNRSNRRGEPTANANANANANAFVPAGGKFARRPDSGVEVEADEMEGWQEGSMSAVGIPYPGLGAGCGPLRDDAGRGWESSDTRPEYGTGARRLMPLVSVVGGETRASPDEKTETATALGTPIQSLSSHMMRPGGGGGGGGGMSRSASGFLSEQPPVSVSVAMPEQWARAHGAGSAAPVPSSSASSPFDGVVGQHIGFAHGSWQDQYHALQAGGGWNGGDVLVWPAGSGQEGLYDPSKFCPVMTRCPDPRGQG
ncbi:hypothetical protein SODALDRAFT_327020 [Sodiomyces alkalinus F11]|uniref:C2H2-type domain-containing protein n=1 Tax=Sodiomyces alkalinus (strain CBS 110278 / VKM F-3762 / F11) TaxID=1314773 RepID=A0A3N2Q7V9_SODAK|nr:hypothetical protein SODALDRAFT_327020 [Sodiomyces alkalinus F11]ROT42861.1 hypothetical protein SODALDRAFT_327020 [Sodiomyces alkalinus F11]